MQWLPANLRVEQIMVVLALWYVMDTVKHAQEVHDSGEVEYSGQDLKDPWEDVDGPLV